MKAFSQSRLSTHDVENQPDALVDYSLFEADAALKEGVTREGADWAAADLARFGAKAGAADYLELGALANRYPPEFDTHDRYGRRVDLVRFHPAYHELMRVAVAEGVAASPWDAPGPGDPCRARREVLHADASRGWPPLSHHHDLRGDADAAARAGAGARMAAAPPFAPIRCRQRAGRGQGGRDDGHGDDRETGRLRRARQHHPRRRDRRRRL